MVELPWPAVKSAAEKGALVLLPVGVIEEHGPHMGLGIDAYMGYQKCVRYKRELESRGVPTVIAPAVYWGVMQSHQSGAYPGSFTVRPSTMKALLLDVLADLRAWGFRRVFALNQHGDRVHTKTFAEALAEARDTLGLEFYNDHLDDDHEGAPDVSALVPKDLFMPDYHAGAGETSSVAAYFPEEVDLGVAKTLKPEGTFHPLGYVGNPADFARLDMAAIDKLEMAYYADCIARWMKTPAGSKKPGDAKKQDPSR